jgi:hypothetical protein
MGAWGTAIFSDDTALDVREECRDAILWLLEVFGLALVLAHSTSLVEAFGGPTPISLAEFRAGG